MRATTLVKSANTEPLLTQGVREKIKLASPLANQYSLFGLQLSFHQSETRSTVPGSACVPILMQKFSMSFTREQVPVEVKGGPPTLVTMDLARERFFEFYNSDQFVVRLKRNDFKFWVKVG